MAEKIFQTRILNKIDTLENWQSSTLKIKNGEICIATVAASAGSGLTEPVCMIKVGGAEEKTFSELPWSFYAKASDVLTACKSEEALTAFIDGVIAKAGIATDKALSDLAARVGTAEGEVDTLQSEMDAVEGKAAANEGAIAALQGLVGSETVAKQIEDKIAALKLSETYDQKGAAEAVQTALDTYKTSNDAAVQKNATDISGEIARAKAAEEANSGAISAIKDGTTIDSFADVEAALAGKQATGEYATKTEAQGYADAKDGAIAAAKKAGDDAAAAAKAAQDDVDALELLVGSTAVSTQIDDKIDALDLGNTYAAKEHTHTKSEITDFAHTHAIGEVDGLQAALDGKQAAGDYATKSEAQGYANAKDEAIAAAQGAADKAQGEVDALEELVGSLPADAGVATIVAYVDKKTAGIATDVALGELTERVGTAEDKIATLEGVVGDAEGGLVKGVADNAAAIAQLAEDAAADIADAVAAEKERAEGIEGGLRTDVDAIKGDYLKAADKEALQTQINTIMNNPDAEGAINSINEFTAYVTEHGTIADGMRADINKNKDDIVAEAQRAAGVEGGLDTRLQAVEAAVGESGSVAGDIADALAEAKGYTDTEVKELADGAVAANATAIGALQTKVGEKTVAEQITDVTNPLAERVVALEAVDHDHANKTVLDGISAEKVSAWDAKIDDITAAADSGIKATRTGNTVAIELDDTITYIFDCGNARGGL